MRKKGLVRLTFHSSHESLGDFLSSEYVERIVEGTVYGFLRAIFHPSSLTPSVFTMLFRLRSFYVRPREMHDCKPSAATLADSWLAILDRHHLCNVSTVFMLRQLMNLLIDLKELQLFIVVYIFPEEINVCWKISFAFDKRYS